ncbi:MAG TPA: glycoside hydrolase family 3 protein [Bellilinea sp.]|nr:glycoside hydrolase family 3 protein [Bellilinea sp.]
MIFRKNRLLPVLLLIAVTLSACNRVTGTETPIQPPEISVTETATPEVLPPSDPVEALLAQMTLAEKIGQMTQVEQYSLKAGDSDKYFIGSVISGGGSVPTTADTREWAETFVPPAAPQTRLGIPILYAVDAIHGIGALYGATVFPQPIGLGAGNHPELMRQIGQATAEEMRAIGISWNFAPIVAVPQDIRWGRTYESYSEDTQRVVALSTAFIQGLQSLPKDFVAAEGQSLYTLATPKHYLGDGGTAFGTSTQNIFKPYLIDQGDTQLTEAEMREYFLPAYQAAVETGAMSIMVSFSSWNGTKMHAQSYWINDVLKGELGFEGFVVSDWGGIDQISENYYEAVVTAINAGVDMNMVPYDYVKFINAMERGVMKGDITLERIDDAVRRILNVKYQLGLFGDTQSNLGSLDDIGSEAHRALARQAVRESLVLLKNENSALPIAKDADSIIVAGIAANDMGIQCGGWTTEWQGETGDVQPGTTILEAIRAAVSPATTVTYSQDGQFEGTAEIGIAVVGETPYAEGVGDASDLSLSDKDLQVITNLREHSQKLIVILISGRPLVITEQFPLADAWVAAWLPGTEGAGVADGLFGDYPFSGTLPYTWPRSKDQLPLNTHTVEGLTGCAAPLFPFGYGLGVGSSQPAEWLNCPSNMD